MTPERWAEIRDVLEAALELPAGQRIAYLDGVCPADASLRGEVESLLAADDRARSSFLQSPPLPRVRLSKGTKLGDYKVISLIGAGGMGEVYRARDLRLGRDVAIKVLPSSYSFDPDRLRRFEQEARAAAALNHPNILAVFQMGTHQGAPYLVSELLEGDTLRGQMKGQQIPVRKAIDCATQLARGLTAAHEKGIVHRDLKPANVFLTKDGRVKILDFGLAKLIQREQNSVEGLPMLKAETQPGVVMGTAGYMAPEQIRGQSTDRRADIFGFGAILYEMLTGTRAFQKPTSAETMSAILNEDPPSISRIVPNIPPALRKIAHRCLEKNPDQRFQSASDLAFALEALSDIPSSREPFSHAVYPSATLRASLWEKLRTHRNPGIVAVLIVLAAAGLGVYSLLTRPPTTPFQKFTATQVTNSGKVTGAAISSDGKYVLSVTDDNGLQSLWLRNVPTGSDTQVLAPSATDYRSLAFSPDGNYMYFRKSVSSIQYNLYRCAMPGTTPQTVVQDIDTDVAFSPVGQRIAYVRNNAPEAGKYSILTASLDGNNEKAVQMESTQSGVPKSLAWSGDEIAYAFNNHVGHSNWGEIDILDVGTGKSRRFAAFRDKHLAQIRWSPDGRALFVAYERPANYFARQIGVLSSKGGDIEPITRDTNAYYALTVSADGRTLASIVKRSYATISVLSKTGSRFVESRPLISTVNEFNRLGWLRWSADGNLLVSEAHRLLKLGVDGKSQSQLLADSNAIIFEPSSCGAKYLVLSWAFHGGTNSVNIWRTDADGSGTLRLTNGSQDRNPVCSPDRKWVYYVDYSTGAIISRVPVDGSGKAEALFTMPRGYSLWAEDLGVSPDGKTFAVNVVDSSGAVKVALFDWGSATSPRILDTSNCSGHLQFTPDGKAVAYKIRAQAYLGYPATGEWETTNGVDNVWVQPLDGSPGHRITDFNSEQIWSFNLSPDGNSLATLRGHVDSDVVLLQESKP